MVRPDRQKAEVQAMKPGKTSRLLMECRRAAAKRGRALFVVHHSMMTRYVARLPVVSDCDFSLPVNPDSRFMKSELHLPEGGIVEIVALSAIEDKLRGTRAAVVVDHAAHELARSRSEHRALRAIDRYSTRVDNETPRRA
jgi:hypothetical protein